MVLSACQQIELLYGVCCDVPRARIIYSFRDQFGWSVLPICKESALMDGIG